MNKPAEHARSRWHAVVTRYRNEKIAVKLLEKRGIHAYIPLIQKRHHYASRKKTFWVPLINCYVFVRIQPSEIVKVLEVPNVFHFVKFKDKIAEISDKEIETLTKISNSNLAASPFHSNFKAGDKIEIKFGILKGIQGYLTKVQNKTTFIVRLESLNQSIIIDMQDDLIRKVER